MQIPGVIRLPLCILLLLLGGGPWVSRAASPEEDRAYTAVLKLFQDGVYDVAERDCEAFRKAFAGSEREAEIALLQAQARLKLKRVDDAIQLLTQAAPQAGKLADEYAYWQAEALYEKGDLAAAADGFARVVSTFPESGRGLDACYSEAYTRYRQGDLGRAVTVLQDPKSAFAQLAQAQPADERVIRSWLLLAEMLLNQRNLPSAESTLTNLTGKALGPDLDWRRQFLLAHLKLAADEPAVALGFATNLWTAATNTVPLSLQADAALLHGEILERLNQPAAALQAYERALADGLPGDRRRAALQRTIDLIVRQGPPREGAERLEAFIKAHPQDEMLDQVRLTLGELLLRESQALMLTNAPAASLSNVLAAAGTQFEFVVTNYPNSPLVGRAQLGRGWRFWAEGTNRLGESLLAFKAATERLPGGPEQAVARFKWADCQFELRDFPGAISNYWVVATNREPGATNTLPGQALYQIVRAGVAGSHLDAASAALAELVKTDTALNYADRASLLVGQALSRAGKTLAARALFDDFVQRFTNSMLLPEVKLRIAGSFEQEQDLPAAIGAYSNWLATYVKVATVPTNMVAQATFDLARLHYQASPDTNALRLLTNFVARFPSDPNASVAQYLVGEYYFGQNDFGNAELHFQHPALALNRTPSPGEVAWRARLMAGRAAVALQNYRSARSHFAAIITNGPLSVADSPVPVRVVAEAYLLRGDILTQEPVEGETNKLARFGEAINAFSRITEHFPTNDLAPLAWGRIGDCHLQLATQDPKRYDAAAEAYRRVIESPADVATRSQGEFKLAAVLEKQAQLRPAAERTPLEDQALDLYLRVLYGRNLRDGELPDPYWMKRAGLAAADLAETQKKWDLAISLCQRLIAELPPLRARLQKRIDDLQAARQKAAAERG